MFLWCVRDGWRDIYSERGLLRISSFGGPGGANACTPLQARQRHLWLAACSSLDCNSLHSVQIWLRGSYHMIPMIHDDVLSFSCLLIKMWQLTKAHGFTRNKPKIQGGCPRGVMVKVMDCEIVVREYVVQSCYYIHFRANTLGKGMNPLIFPAMG